VPADPGQPPPPPPAAEPLDWRDQVIYFVMTDRFNDGDPSNNDQGAGEYDSADGARYSGGDLQGITDKVDYIQHLGATAVWITPPVANQWWDPQVNYGGYHGYWAENFTEVDRHAGDLETYKTLSAALHARGMLLIQDIVVNHTGNFFHCDPDPGGGEPACAMNAGSVPVSAPTEPPFDKDDPGSAEDRAASIYHFTPPISDYADQEQRFDYQLADLDDLDTDNPEVVRALKDSYNHWIREVGVDGFRIDTVVYTHPETYADFLRGADPEHPGVKTFAEGPGGKESFFTFGETWFTPTPYDDAADLRVEEYLQKDGAPLLDSALNFPLHFDLQAVFAGGKPTRQLGYRLERALSVHRDPARLVNFIDNHDRDRFLTIGSPAALKQALTFLLTIPGVPVIYYGTEQSLLEQRGSMFAAGFGSGGADHFDEGAEMYRFLQEMIALRKGNAVFRRGALRLLRDSGAGPGVFAYALLGDAETAVVLFNTSEHRALVDGPDSGLPAGAELKLLSGVSAGGDLTVGAGGQLVAALEPRSAAVLLTTGVVGPPPDPEVAVTLDFPADTAFSANPEVSGTLTGADELLLVIDGDLTKAQAVTAAPDGTWSATLLIESMVPDPSVVHTVVAYVESAGAVFERHEFTVDLEFKPVTEVVDPDGDDHGPTGAYAYPTDATYADPTMDLHKVTVTAAGNTLRLSFEMNALSTVWNPANGFDHVSLSVYVDVPDKTGVAALPFQNATAPGGMQWDYLAIVGGWVNALYSADGASATSSGASASPAPTISVDPAARTIDLTFTPESFGDLQALSGVRIYVTTWDYDGGYRPLTPLPEQWKFSGGDGAVSPLIMDDALIDLP
jgi:glycosidase